MSISDWAGAVSDWREGLEEVKGLVAPVFRRSEQRLSAGAFIDGLLSGAPRKTGWMLAEAAGLAQPYRIQSLLGRSIWSADELCARVRHYALDALRDRDGVLVVDETGFLKKAAIPSASGGNIPERRGGSRTVRSGCLPAMPAVGVMR